MFTKMFAVALVAAGMSAPAWAAAAPTCSKSGKCTVKTVAKTVALKTAKADCCAKSMACCKPQSACCAAPAKTGCCAKGQACCDKQMKCCQAVQACCEQGKACCDEGKPCCGSKHRGVQEARKS